MAKKRKTVRRRKAVKPRKVMRVHKKRKAAKPRKKRKLPVVVVTPENILQIKKMKNVILHAFRYTKPDGRSYLKPNTKPVLVTKPEAILKVKNANTNNRQDCARGVNVGTAEFCRKGVEDSWHKRKAWLVEFRPQDVAATPYDLDTDWGGKRIKTPYNKFRLFRCRVVKQVTLKTLKKLAPRPYDIY